MIKRDSIQIDSPSKKCDELNAKTQKLCTFMISKPLTKESWLLENHHAITAYNQHIIDDGVFSDGLRCF